MILIEPEMERRIRATNVCRSRVCSCGGESVSEPWSLPTPLGCGRSANGLSVHSYSHSHFAFAFRISPETVHSVLIYRIKPDSTFHPVCRISLEYSSTSRHTLIDTFRHDPTPTFWQLQSRPDRSIFDRSAQVPGILLGERLVEGVDGAGVAVLLTAAFYSPFPTISDR